MKQFEYDILFFDVKKRKDFFEMRRILNQRGEDSWEVITAEAGDYGYTTFVKRKIVETSK